MSTAILSLRTAWQHTRWMMVFVLLLLGVGIFPAQASTVLAPGDIAITGVNMDNPDQFAFVLLVDVLAGTQITFTDSGWESDNTFRNSEGAVKYTFPSNSSAGTVILFNGVAGDWAVANDANVGTNGFNLAVDGDQIIAFQGPSASPTFIFAMQTYSTQWQTSSVNSNDSAIPSGLVNGSTAIAFGKSATAGDEWDNA